MSDNESEILFESDGKARKVLHDTRAEARTHITLASDVAAALEIVQRGDADRLISEYAEVAADDLHSAELKALGMTPTAALEFLKRKQQEAEELLAAQQRVAGVLLAAQREAAVKLQESSDHEAADILMWGQREAAAILLEARMRIEAIRSDGMETEDSP